MDEQILSELKDVHLPLEPSLLPLAWGYYAVILIVLSLAIALFFLLRHSLKKSRLRKNYMAQLSAIELKFNETHNVSQLQTQLSWLIRNLARMKYPANSSLVAVENVELSLERLCKNKSKKDELLRLLNQDRFRAISHVNGDELLQIYKELSKTWRV
ncbi:MAG: DUF4381 family protein [Myxococcales bacterium]|nr:DUF4381 family protein [Myxococcales bacterium]USN51199.1 MAG: DUF4381 family protein [Myxococcales bacterium]